MNESGPLRRPRPLALKKGLADFGEHFSEWRRLQNLSVAVRSPKELREKFADRQVRPYGGETAAESTRAERGGA